MDGERTSLMPSKYTHLNQDDLDSKMLEIMGVKKPEITEEPLRECAFCKISYPVETRFCDSCSRPLDVADAIQMEKESQERTKDLVMEIMRKESQKKSRNITNKQKERKLVEQGEKIKQLEGIIRFPFQKANHISLHTLHTLHPIKKILFTFLIRH